MALTGILRTWNEDRGFGFIAPKDGGRELFVHISAFPRDGSRPTVGETLVYELGRGKDGKPQAVRVHRQAWGPTSASSKGQANARRASRSTWRVIVGSVLVIALGAYGYSKYQRLDPNRRLSISAPTSPDAGATEIRGGPFRCDGRTHCSEMTSCSEAKFFLKNCPGVKMDGNHDGTPCEQQWCTSPFAD